MCGFLIMSAAIGFQFFLALLGQPWFRIFWGGGCAGTKVQFHHYALCFFMHELSLPSSTQTAFLPSSTQHGVSVTMTYS